MQTTKKVHGVLIDYIACTIPKQCMTLTQYAPNLFDSKTAHKIELVSGFTSLRIAPKEMTSADLFLNSAECVLDRLRSVGGGGRGFSICYSNARLCFPSDQPCFTKKIRATAFYYLSRHK